MRLFPENTADYRFKMYANRRDCKADLRWDRPELPIREQNTAMGVVVWNSGTMKKKEMWLFIIIKGIFLCLLMGLLVMPSPRMTQLTANVDET
jgi:hypothetical protein